MFIFNTHSLLFQYFSLSLSDFDLRPHIHIQHPLTFFSTFHFHFLLLTCGLIFNTHSLLSQHFSLSLSSFDLRPLIHIQHQFRFVETLFTFLFWSAASYSYSTPIHFYFYAIHFHFLLFLTCGLIFIFNTNSQFFNTIHFPLFDLRSHIHIQHPFTFISTLFTFLLWPAVSYSNSTPVQILSFLFTFTFFFWCETSYSYSTPVHVYFNTFHSHFLLLICDLLFIFNTHSLYFQHF